VLNCQITTSIGTGQVVYALEYFNLSEKQIVSISLQSHLNVKIIMMHELTQT
jgi:hypothetical protein